MRQNTLSGENALTQGKIFPALMRFAIPFLVANFLQQLYGAVDLLVVGQFCDTAAVSAVSTGSQVMKTITGIVTGLATGTTVLVGQYIGAGRREDRSAGSLLSGRVARRKTHQKNAAGRDESPGLLAMFCMDVIS